MIRALLAVAASLATLATMWLPATVSAEPVSRIRMMLHPYAAPGGSPLDGTVERLQAISGLAWRAIGTTRTGALELALDSAIERRALEPALRRLRIDRAVLWVDIPRPPTSLIKRAAATRPTDRLVVRLASSATPDWAALLPKFETLIGHALLVERQTDAFWVLRLPAPIDLTDAQFAAERLQNDPAVRFADPVKRVHPSRTPNDPLFPLQWGLFDPVSGINAPAAWDVTTGDSDLVVAVVDTGIVDHPELAGRVLPGYDFIADRESANDGDGRDRDPTDPGDWSYAGECEDGSGDLSSSWHGTFVAGIIAAGADNGSGLTGINWNARILPVRALGKCGGSDLDVLEAILWSAGNRISGVPVNATPARVINLSLGGFGPCSSSMQQAIDTALAQGAVVVAAAGNESGDTSEVSPANCSGVINVSAHQRSGQRAGYSNFGPRVDISAPGGDGEIEDWIVSTSNAGRFMATEAITAYAIGTSYAAPHVSGTASLLFAKNRLLTPGRVLTALQGSARPHPLNSGCAYAPLCGPGLLDASLALAVTPTPMQDAPPGTVSVIEYHRADVDRYFITADDAEMAVLDASPGKPWQRTGLVFFAYPSADAAPGLQPVCRFYGNPAAFLDSHYFTADAAECAFVLQRWAGVWTLENPSAFHIRVPDAAGRCPSNTLPVYRFFNGKQDANHRYTLDLTIRRTMLNRSWIAEGNGADAVAFCSPV